MENVIYRLEDGRLWDTREACWLSENPVALLSDEGEPHGEAVVATTPVRDLVSANGVSDKAYLAETLEFYGFPLGCLAFENADAIRKKLAELDAVFLTPRVLAGLAIGDAYAASRWNEHEAQAIPLRQKLAELEAAMENPE